MDRIDGECTTGVVSITDCLMIENDHMMCFEDDVLIKNLSEEHKAKSNTTTTS